MFEVIKKLPILLALFTGETLGAIDEATEKVYKVKYSSVSKKFVITPALKGEKFKFNISYSKLPF